MVKMWMSVAVYMALLGLAVGDETCERLDSLPHCAGTCFSATIFPTCSETKQFLCATDYATVISCYERQCDLRDYLCGIPSLRVLRLGTDRPDAMNTTHTVCDIPPRSRQSTQIALGSAFIALTTVVVGLRLIGRPPLSASFGIDDAIGLLTYCTAMTDTVLMIKGAQVGWGTDMWALSRSEIIAQMKFFYVGIIFFYFSVSVAKLSILFFYLRIFTTRPFKRVTYGVIALCSAYAIAVVFQSAFDCTPASFYWNRFDGVSQGTCLDYAAFKVMPPVNIALDVVVMALPLPLLVRLNLPLAKKIRVISMFSVGILIIIAGILRITHLYHSITTYNITYNGGELSYFGIIEADVSVICTCMPAIAALLKRVLPRWFGSSSETTYRTFQTEMSPRRGTFHSGTNARQPAEDSEDDIHLFTVMSDDSRLQKPESSFSPVRASK
ncbi:hypothetical protein BJX99DRAFT_256063 [Aspergillus californicus]